ncbi:hypothetical protein BN134_2518 [Cronobacter dublinensis 1210]|uniref:Uncharacterized protein n=1 Tax=Cronobacter dublinensis 1210 TaxID=1208656 RepID=A0ABP1W8F2_9ENTR|nr:hypothetical protein BN134_2518 [Cronobacter dublinensis 1210]
MQLDRRHIGSPRNALTSSVVHARRTWASRTPGFSDFFNKIKAMRNAADNR